MHPNSAFRTETEKQNLDFARARSFGTLAMNGPDGLPMISHVPFLLSSDGSQAELHLVRSNPIFRAAQTPVPAVIALNGPDGYVSPDWYGDETHAQVPTWNYVAVHLRGVLEARAEVELKDHLDRLSAQFEARLSPKQPWHSDKMPDGVMDKMMRAIGVFSLQVDSVAGTWKLNQNKACAHRMGAAEAMAQSPIGHHMSDLAELMRKA